MTLKEIRRRWFSESSPDSWWLALIRTMAWAPYAKTEAIEYFAESYGVTQKGLASSKSDDDLFKLTQNYVLYSKDYDAWEVSYIIKAARDQALEDDRTNNLLASVNYGQGDDNGDE